MHTRSLTLLGLSLILGSLKCLAQETNVASTVTVFFQQRTTLTANELVAASKSALSKKGVVDFEKYHVGINVSFNPPQAGCIVLFSQGFGRPYHHVRFNHAGKITETHSGVLKEFVGDVKELDPASIKELEKLTGSKIDPGKK